jgi:hypothetical protein
VHPINLQKTGVGSQGIEQMHSLAAKIIATHPAQDRGMVP